MSLELYAHPSPYCQKVIIALYENATPFEPRMLGADERIAAYARERAGRSGRCRCSSTRAAPWWRRRIIVEHLDSPPRAACASSRRPARRARVRMMDASSTTT
jgi:glutathione S-transferase